MGVKTEETYLKIGGYHWTGWKATVGFIVICYATALLPACAIVALLWHYVLTK